MPVDQDALRRDFVVPLVRSSQGVGGDPQPRVARYASSRALRSATSASWSCTFNSRTRSLISGVGLAGLVLGSKSCGADGPCVLALWGGMLLVPASYLPKICCAV